MSYIESAGRLRPVIERAAESLSDDWAARAPDFYPSWSGEGISYKTGQRLRHRGRLFRVVSGHISQCDWSPDNSPSLFAEILLPDESRIPIWRQPESHNGYERGQRVEHKGKIYRSETDYNVFEPGTAGAPWREE